MEAIYEVICWGRPRDKSIHGLGFFKDKNLADSERLQHAEKMCGHWLHLANQAEKGNKELAEIRYKKAQPWLDKINRILGNS